MSKGKRNRYSAEFKAKVAKEAMKGEETLAQLAVRFGVHSNLVAQWKKQAMEGLKERDGRTKPFPAQYDQAMPSSWF